MIVYSEHQEESKTIDIPTQNIISWIDVSDDMKFMAISTNMNMLVWDVENGVEYQCIQTDHLARLFCYFSDDSKWLLFSSKYSQFCLLNLDTQKQLYIRVDYNIYSNHIIQHFGGLDEICINRFNIISKIIDGKCQIFNLQTFQFSISDEKYKNRQYQMDLMKDNNSYFCSYFLDQTIPGQQSHFEIWNIQRFRICYFFIIINAQWMHTKFKINKTMIAIFCLKQSNKPQIVLRNIFNNKLISTLSIDACILKMNFSANNNYLNYLYSNRIGQLDLATRQIKTQNMQINYLKTFISNNGKYLILQEDNFISIKPLC